MYVSNFFASYFPSTVYPLFIAIYKKVRKPLTIVLHKKL